MQRSENENAIIRRMICIMCPASCHLEVKKGEETGEGKEEYIICGNHCAGGKNYALNEMRDPKRIVTAVVRSDSRKIPCIPVKTDSPLKMEYMDALLQELFSRELSCPVKCGEIVISDFKNTGVNVVVTRSVED